MIPGYYGRRLLYAIAFLSLSFLQTSFAQGVGTIKGVVFDRTSKDRLPGANVVVKGTSVGTTTNLNGEYVIRNAPTGSQTIIVTYIGYTAASVAVNIPAGVNVNQDFGLMATTILGAEVVVTAQAQGQLQAINQQIASNKIVSIVSEAKMQELPDFNAAAAIGRLPGVSTLQSSGEANKVVIRGLAPQFNEVAVGGITLASTGSTQIGAASQGGTAGSINTDRSVDLTTITPYMLKAVEVYKSLTPDMNANALGGYVNMELREAPEGLKTDLLLQSGYTQKSGRYGNYRLVAAGSDRFLDGDLGLYILANSEKYDRNADNMNAAYETQSSTVQPDGFRPAQVTTVTLDRHFETRERFGGNVILDYKLPSGTIKSVNLLSRLNSNTSDYSTIFDYKFHPINFRYNQGITKTDMAINSLELENDFGFMSAEVRAANTYSRTYDPDAPQFDFSQTGGIPGGQLVNTPPEELIPAIQYKTPALTYLTNVSLFSSDYKENDQVYKIDLKAPLNVENVLSGFIKVGGDFRYNLHTNQQGTPYAGLRAGSGISNQLVNLIAQRYGLTIDPSANEFPATNFTSPNGTLTNSFLNNHFGSMLWAGQTDILNSIVHLLPTVPSVSAIYSTGTNPGGWFDSPYQRLPNSYKYIEKYYAGYAMTELDFAQNVMVVGGVRWEEVRSYFDAFNLADGRDATSQEIDTVSAHPGNRFLLPMVQAKWDVLDWVDVRYSFTQTLARPDYSQLSPHFNLDYTKTNVWAGNPNLKTAESNNHDIFVTFHSNELGLLSLGGFYKEITNFTYYTQYALHNSPPPGLDSIGSFAVTTPTGSILPKDGALLNTYVNSPYKAFVRGLEVDFQTRLWYLPEPLNGIVFGVNYTHISSAATYPWRNDTTVVIPPRTIKIVTLDRTRSGRLINQPNDVVNAYLGYDYLGFSGRLSFLFQGNSVSYIGPFAEQDGFTEDYFRIDASVRQKLPWAGLQVFLDVNNLNNRMNESVQASFRGFSSEQFYGLVANLGIRYTM